MQPKLSIAVLIVGLATAAPAGASAQSGSDLSVRNDSRETLNCRVTRQGRSTFETVVLRAGQAWNARDARPYNLFCDPPAAAVRYRLRSGTAYRLVPDSESVRIVLRSD
jgi:hypothetical protein